VTSSGSRERRAPRQLARWTESLELHPFHQWGCHAECAIGRFKSDGAE